MVLTERCCVLMKIKQIVAPFSYIIQGEYAEINAVQFSYYCPKCNIKINHEKHCIFELKYCFNCGQKLDIGDTEEIELVPKPIKPIKIKMSDIFSNPKPVELCGEIFETIYIKDISKYL